MHKKTPAQSMLTWLLHFNDCLAFSCGDLGACYSSTIPGCPSSRQRVKGLLGDVGAKYGCPVFCMKQTNVTSSNGWRSLIFNWKCINSVYFSFLSLVPHPCGGDVSVLLCSEDVGHSMSQHIKTSPERWSRFIIFFNLWFSSISTSSSFF